MIGYKTIEDELNFFSRVSLCRILSTKVEDQMIT